MKLKLKLVLSKRSHHKNCYKNCLEQNVMQVVVFFTEPFSFLPVPFRRASSINQYVGIHCLHLQTMEISL